MLHAAPEPPARAAAVPTRKNLPAGWLRSLVMADPDHDAPISASEPQALAKIAMPLGRLRLAGDGRLLWEEDGFPPAARKPGAAAGRSGDGKRPGFRLEIADRNLPLEAGGWASVRFEGQWPAARVTYRDDATPLQASLLAWSPWIPLDPETSARPVVVLEYEISNPSDAALSCVLSAVLPNPFPDLARAGAVDAGRSRIESRPEAICLLHESAGISGEGVALVALDPAAVPDEADEADAPSSLRVPLSLAPGESRTVAFLLCWHFDDGKPAPAGSPGLAEELEISLENRLGWRETTLLWVRTWHDTSLPQWLVQRSILGASPPAMRRQAGQKGGAELRHYQQAVAHVFPQIERARREAELAEAAPAAALPTEARAGQILMLWREHYLAPDGAFLERVWPAARTLAEGFLAEQGSRTQPAAGPWPGSDPGRLSLRLAALEAASRMAVERSDLVFSQRCRKFFEEQLRGLSLLFRNGFYRDPSAAQASAAPCSLDQALGQWWAGFAGLDRVADAKSLRGALDTLWKHHFLPDIATEAGTLARSQGGRPAFSSAAAAPPAPGFWSGLEAQFAALLIREGAPLESNDGALEAIVEDAADPRASTLRGLAVARAVHDRHAPARGNPYDESTGPDAGARAAAAWSVYLAACGFRHHGPQGEIAFAPKVGARNFRAAFLTAGAWGRYRQTVAPGDMTAIIEVLHGHLPLTRISLSPAGRITHANARLGTENQTPIFLYRDGAATLALDPPLEMKAGDRLIVSLA